MNTYLQLKLLENSQKSIKIKKSIQIKKIYFQGKFESFFFNLIYRLLFLFLKAATDVKTINLVFDENYHENGQIWIISDR